jgi:phytoene dehydrogenase-like protein
MTTERWDAIVIGAGLGGLTCAAYLAAGGLRVLVLEQHTVAGGNTQVFRRRGRYEFDVGAHYLGDCGPHGVLPRIYRGLGLAGRIAFREIEPDGFDRIVLPSVTVDVPRGWDRYRERMVAALPAETGGVGRFVDACAAAHDQLRRAALAPAGDEPAARRGVVDMRGGTATLGALMRRCGLSGRARTLLAGQAGNYGVAPDEVAVSAHTAMLGDYLLGAYHPEGGGQMLAAALVEALEGNGGELRTRSLVTGVVVERGRVAGVRLDHGEVLRAPVVVSNADYRRTVLDLVGAEHFPSAAVVRARRAQMALPVLTLYLAVAAGAVEPLRRNIWWHESEDVDAVFAELTGGGFTRPRFAFISPGWETVDGHHIVEVMTLAPYRLVVDDETVISRAYRKHPRYRMEKDRLDAALFALAERALGPLDGHVLHRELATPATHVRFARSTGGTPYGLASTPRQFGPLRPTHRTALPGLYLAGASTETGFGIVAVALGGIRCAEAVLGRSLLAEVRAGSVFGDPSRLPDRPPGWDPLRVCRGIRRRKTIGRGGILPRSTPARRPERRSPSWTDPSHS